MDWEQLRERTLGEVGTALATEGVGVAGGFIGAGFVGRQIQDRIKKDAEIVTIGDKVIAWASNNVPKLAIWWALKKYAAVTPGEILTPGKEVVVDVKKAFAGSVFFDTIMRLFNDGKNPAIAQIGGWAILGSEQQKSVQADLQRLIQENSALRTELNKALQRLATVPTVHVQPLPQPVVRPAPVAPVAPATPAAPTPAIKAEEIAVQQVPPGVAERERRYGFMQYETTPPIVQERQRRYGFAGEEKNIATMFGML